MSESKPRYILMRHDPSGDNRQYVARSYLTVTDEMPSANGLDGVDVVQVLADGSGRGDQDEVDTLAWDTLQKLQGGLEARSALTFHRHEDALTSANSIVRAIDIREARLRKEREGNA